MKTQRHGLRTIWSNPYMKPACPRRYLPKICSRTDTIACSQLREETVRDCVYHQKLLEIEHFFEFSVEQKGESTTRAKSRKGGEKRPAMAATISCTFYSRCTHALHSVARRRRRMRFSAGGGARAGAGEGAGGGGDDSVKGLD